MLITSRHTDLLFRDPNDFLPKHIVDRVILILLFIRELFTIKLDAFLPHPNIDRIQHEHRKHPSPNAIPVHIQLPARPAFVNDKHLNRGHPNQLQPLVDHLLLGILRLPPDFDVHRSHPDQLPAELVLLLVHGAVVVVELHANNIRHLDLVLRLPLRPDNRAPSAERGRRSGDAE